MLYQPGWFILRSSLFCANKRHRNIMKVYGAVLIRFIVDNFINIAMLRGSEEPSFFRLITDKFIPISVPTFLFRRSCVNPDGLFFGRPFFSQQAPRTQAFKEALLFTRCILDKYIYSFVSTFLFRRRYSNLDGSFFGRSFPRPDILRQLFLLRKKLTMFVSQAIFFLSRVARYTDSLWYMQSP